MFYAPFYGVIAVLSFLCAYAGKLPDPLVGLVPCIFLISLCGGIFLWNHISREQEGNGGVLLKHTLGIIAMISSARAVGAFTANVPVGTYVVVVFIAAIIALLLGVFIAWCTLPDRSPASSWRRSAP